MKTAKQDLGLLILRIGLGGVFLWFGIDKFIKPMPWTQWIPPWFSAILPISVVLFIYLLGVFETVVGLMMFTGFYTKLGAGLASALLVGIIVSTGYNEIMIRDAGLLFLALGIVMLGSGRWSIDEKYLK